MSRTRVHRIVELDFSDDLATLRGLFEARRGAALLHGGDHVFFGAEPYVSFRAWRAEARSPDGRRKARVEIRSADSVRRIEVDDALDALRALAIEHALEPGDVAARPVPFLGGAVGYVGYESGQMLERLPCRPRPQLGMPDMAFFFHRWVIGRSLQTGRTFLSVLGRGATDEGARRDAQSTCDRVCRAVERAQGSRVAFGERTAPRLDELDVLASRTRVRAALSRAEYLSAVDAAKQRIAAGDGFEICLTNASRAPFPHDPWLLWQELRRINPAPFAAWLDLPEGAIVSASPERFLRLRDDRIAESSPIKGTRPRGRDAHEDARLAHDLSTAAKDRAENTMIVDVVRNDLGRVARYGTVEVTGFCTVERHPTVHQLVSTIQGTLREGADALDLLRAAFPPASMTGAPKIRAMEILEDLEPVERGVYAGGLGYLDATGMMDLSVVIRAAVVRDGRVSFSVGGAVVADSDPEAEYRETEDKARAMLAALAAVEQRAPKRESRASPFPNPEGLV